MNMRDMNPSDLAEYLARIRITPSVELDGSVRKAADEAEKIGERASAETDATSPTISRASPESAAKPRSFPMLQNSMRIFGRKFVLAAGIAGLLVCAAVLALRSRSVEHNLAAIAPLTFFQSAQAAEESLFKGEGILGIVNEIIVKPVSDPDLARLRFLPINSMSPSGKLQNDALSLAAKPGEGYGIEDRSWYDQKTGRFARVLTVAGKAIFANSYDGKSVYRLEPDTAGVLKVAGKPVAADFRAPLRPASFLGLTAALTGQSLNFDEARTSVLNVTDAGEVKLPGGSVARQVKLGYSGEGTPQEMRETFWLFAIRKSDNAIAQAECVMNGKSWLVIRRVSTEPASAPGVPWNLAGIAVAPAKPQAPGVQANMVVPDVTVQRMVEKADFETFIFLTDPPWTSKRQIADILDVVSPPERMFCLAYAAADHRHVILVQSPSYNKMLGQFARTGTMAYASPNGCKLWSAPGNRSKWLAGILLQSAQYMTKEKPAENRTGYIIETPAGTFPALAVNGMTTDGELRALIDGLIPAREYLKKFPEAASAPVSSNAATGKEQVSAAASPLQPRVQPDMVLSDVSVQHMVEKAEFETYIFAGNPPWASKREVTDVLDVLSPPKRMFILSYVAGDHRHIIVVQSPSYNRMLGQVVKTGTLVYTSPKGCKVWSAPKDRSKWLAGILLQSAQGIIKEKPADSHSGFIIETPAGTFPALAVNGMLTDGELQALIDSFVPAKEYLKKSSAPAATGSQEGAAPSP